ncbi:MAG: alpha/beta hydrolase [Pseudomonadales bacterium]|nr:alpha/beta hydrolase [Pseudomonadales bacterium]
MNTNITAYKRTFGLILAFLSLLLIASSLAFYSFLQTARGPLHPVFGLVKLMTKEEDSKRIIQALDSADPEALKQYRDLVAQFYLLSGDIQFSGKVEQAIISGKTQPLHAKIYHPDNRQGSEQALAPVIIYYHGGGWSSSNIDVNAKMAKQIATTTGAVVVTPQYRLAPEHVYPAALDDAYTALNWVKDNAEHYAWDKNRIIVAGDSAGGNLAAAVALYSRDHQGPFIAAQLLVYPDLQPLVHDYDAELQALGLQPDAEFLSAVGKAYAGSADAQDIYLSPLAANNLQGLPPALVITAGFDLLTKQGEQYAKKLQEQGVIVKTINFPKVGHGFISVVGLLDESDAAIQAMKSFILSL